MGTLIERIFTDFYGLKEIYFIRENPFQSV